MHVTLLANKKHIPIYLSSWEQNSTLPRNIVLAGEIPVISEMYACALQVSYHGNSWALTLCVGESLNGASLVFARIGAGTQLPPQLKEMQLCGSFLTCRSWLALNFQTLQTRYFYQHLYIY